MKASRLRKSFIVLATSVIILIPGCGVPQLDTLLGKAGLAVSRPETRSTTKPIAAQVPSHPALNLGTADRSKPTPTNLSVAPPAPPLPVLQLGTSGQNALWLNEALAALHYLPVHFSPTQSSQSRTLGAQDSAQTSLLQAATANQRLSTRFPSLTTALAANLETGRQSGTEAPLLGKWKWLFSEPLSLSQLWNPNSVTVVTQGAIISFERQHGLTVDGVVGPQVDNALLHALLQRNFNTQPYTYVTVTKSSPEQLQVWQDGRVIYTSLANTGISQAPTPNGTWPIYLRYISQTMKGTNPSGTKYRDPGVPWVSYFYQGCAIHGFPRASYGFPQSLGCVELPIPAAQTVYSFVHYGTLVTVAS